MSHPFYSIQVRPIFTPDGNLLYRLHNFHDPAGNRLRKGDPKGHPWPFGKRQHWTDYEEESEADKAAVKLQKYLEAYEGSRTQEKP